MSFVNEGYHQGAQKDFIASAFSVPKGKVQKMSGH